MRHICSSCCVAASEFSSAVAEVRGAIGAELLQRLPQEQRLFRAATREDLKNGLLTPLLAAETRKAHLAWAVQDDDSVMLRWHPDDGAPFDHVLATEPALYVRGAEIGPLALPDSLASMAPQELQALVASAPRVAGKQRALLARELASQGLEQAIAAATALAQDRPQRHRGTSFPVARQRGQRYRWRAAA